MCLKIKNPKKIILLWQVPNVLPKGSVSITAECVQSHVANMALGW